jgi:diguanylate cyclase (GGDEF)-like protein/PAS domain S-box-containing protein
MITIKILSILMVLVGAICLSLSFAPSRKIWREVFGPLRRKWLIIIYLMGFFLLGYVFFDIVLISNLPFPVELVTAGVFLGGALFVYLIINISQSTIAERQNAEEEIKILNESLEKRVADRTQALKLSNEFNSTVMDSIADPIAIIDVKTYKIIDVNQAFLRETNLPKEQVLGKTCFEVTHHRTDPCTPPHDACPLKETLSRGDHAVYDHVHRTLAGEKRFVEVLTSPIWNERGKISRVVHIQRDITERKRAEEALRESEESNRLLLQAAGDGIFGVNTKGQVTFVNSAAMRMLGFAEEEMLGKMAHTLIHHSHKDGSNYPLEDCPMYATYTTAAASNVMDEFLWRKDGRNFPVEYSSTPVTKDGKVSGAVVIFQDVTARKQAEEKIWQLAYHDALTGLPNRKLFSDRLGIALAQAQRTRKEIGIAMLDLDNFKEMNDTLGHDTGDLLLKAIAERLRSSLRKGDTVARFGGDEFVLILLDLKGIEDTIQVAQKILDSFHKPFITSTHQLLLTASIGINVYPKDGTDEDVLLRNADKAMYQAKQSGRNQYKLYNNT